MSPNSSSTKLQPPPNNCFTMWTFNSLLDLIHFFVFNSILKEEEIISFLSYILPQAVNSTIIFKMVNVRKCLDCNKIKPHFIFGRIREKLFGEYGFVWTKLNDFKNLNKNPNFTIFWLNFFWRLNLGIP